MASRVPTLPLEARRSSSRMRVGAAARQGSMSMTRASTAPAGQLRAHGHERDKFLGEVEYSLPKNRRAKAGSLRDPRMQETARSVASTARSTSGPSKIALTGKGAALWRGDEEDIQVPDRFVAKKAEKLFTLSFAGGAGQRRAMSPKKRGGRAALSDIPEMPPRVATPKQRPATRGTSRRATSRLKTESKTASAEYKFKPNSIDAMGLESMPLPPKTERVTGSSSLRVTPAPAKGEKKAQKEAVRAKRGMLQGKRRGPLGAERDVKADAEQRMSAYLAPGATAAGEDDEPPPAAKTCCVRKGKGMTSKQEVKASCWQKFMLVAFGVQPGLAETQLRRKLEPVGITNDHVKLVLRKLQIDPEDLRVLRDQYIMIDFSASDVVTSNELLRFLEEPQTMFTKELVDALLIANPSGGELLGFDEFAGLFLWYCQFTKRDILRFAFNLFDKDRSGTLEEAEFVRLTRVLNDPVPLYAGNFAKALNDFDANGDGLLDFGEFLELNKRYPMLLYPAFRLQQAMQRKAFGVSFWQDMGARRADFVRERDAARRKEQQTRAQKMLMMD